MPHSTKDPPQRLYLQGARVSLAGRFRTARLAQYEGWLETWGAELCDIDPDVQVLFAGGTPGRRFALAREMGIPVVEEDALAQAVLRGWVELPVAHGDAPIDALLGEVRSGLAAGDRGRVHAQLEACAPEQLEVLLGYLEGQRGDADWSGGIMERVPWRWPVPRLDRKEHDAFRQEDRAWSQLVTLGELVCGLTPGERVGLASPGWVQQMGLADPKPWHRLVRAVSFWGTGLNGTKAGRLLDNPHLGGLTHLDLGMCTKLSTTFFHKLREHDRARGLRHLALARVEPAQGQALGHDEHAFDALRELTITCMTSHASQNWAMMFEGSIPEQIETLCLRWPTGHYERYAHWQGTWSGLKRLVWSGARWPSEEALDPIGHRLEELVLERVHWPTRADPKADEAFLRLGLREPPDQLDISRVRGDASVDAYVASLIERGSIFDGVLRAKLGEHGTPENVEALEARGVEVVEDA